MECETVNQDLVDFYFGKLEKPMRSACESHVRTCPDCLNEFLTIKRNIELPAEAHELPDRDLKFRLTERLHAPKAFFRFPIRPVFQGALIAAGIAGIALVSLQYFQRATSPSVHSLPAQAEIDSARETSVALSML